MLGATTCSAFFFVLMLCPVHAHQSPRTGCSLQTQILHASKESPTSLLKKKMFERLNDNCTTILRRMRTKAQHCAQLEACTPLHVCGVPHCNTTIPCASHAASWASSNNHPSTKKLPHTLTIVIVPRREKKLPRGSRMAHALGVGSTPQLFSILNGHHSDTSLGARAFNIPHSISLSSLCLNWSPTFAPSQPECSGLPAS